MVEDAGGAFFLVHVATPLEECERRDRKGLYAKARAGEIPEFTGISSPYEEPEDPAVRVDTTGRTIEDALDDVLGRARRGRLPPPDRAGGHRRMTEPLSVLFLCTANICRSPAMELIARDLAGPDADVVFSSSGTHARTRPPDEPGAWWRRSRRLDAVGLPQPPAEAGDPARRRPGADRRVDPPPARARRLPAAAPQALHPRPVRRRRGGDPRPRRAASSSPRSASGVRRHTPSSTSPTPTGAGRRPPRRRPAQSLPC